MAIMTTNADAGNFIPEKLAEEIYMKARNESLLAPLMSLGVVRQDSRLRGSSGKSFVLPKMSHLTASALTEGTDTPIVDPTTTSVTVTVQEHGLATRITKFAEVSAIREFVPTLKRNMAEALRDHLDVLLINELATTTTTPIYPNGKDSSSVTDSDVFDVKLVFEGSKYMKENNVVPKALVIAPKQEYDLKANAGTNFTPVYNDQIITNGVIGRLNGIPVYVSNYITSAQENSTDVYEAFLLGVDAVVYSVKKDAVLEIDDTPKVSRAVTFHLFGIYGFTKFLDEAIVPLKSA